MPITHDIIRKRGDTYPIEVSVLKENGAPIDLTGAGNFILGVAATKIVTAPDVPAALLPGTIKDPAAGTVEFALSASETADLTPGDYYAEIQFEQGGYVITTETFRYRVNGQIVI